MSQPDHQNIGIIAGNGIYPRTFARAARRAGVQKLAVAAFLNETEASLADEVDVIEWLRVGQLSKMIKFFIREGGDQRRDGRANCTSKSVRFAT